MDDLWVAYDVDAGDFETFATFVEAEKWLLEGQNQDGIGECFMDGSCWIAKITHRSKFIKTDQKEDYAEGEWPYDPDWDYIGVPALEALLDPAQADALREVHEDIRQCGETEIDIGGDAGFIRGIYKAMQLIETAILADKQEYPQ